MHNGGVALIKDNSHLFIRNCIINNTFASKGGVFFINTNTKLLIENT